MATTKKITMREFNGTDYDILYPKTDVNQVENLTPAAIGAYPNGIKGAVNCNNLSDGAWTISASATNGPGAFACTLFHKDWNVDFASQIAFGADHNVYYRVKTARSWIDWQEMYSTLRYPSPAKTGSYVGTGTYGESNKNTLTFSFEPKFLYVYTNTGFRLYTRNSTTNVLYNNLLWAEGITSVTVFTDENIISRSGKTITWYADDSTSQLNDSSTTYYYVAIG